MFSILETWNHRPAESSDVLGLIIGTKTNGVITLHEAHYIQHTLTREPQLELECDLQRVRAITSMARSINNNYVVVGWFTTYTEIDNVHRIIQNHFAQEFDESELCLLTVDTTLSQNSLSPTLYTHNNVAVAASDAKQSQLTLFTKVPLNTVIPTQERLALHAFISGNTHESEEIDAPIALVSNAQRVDNFLFGDLKDSLAEALNYVNQVISGEIQGDINIGKKLAYICANIPSYDQETVDSFLGGSLDDLKMFSGLAQATKQTVSTASLSPQ